MPTARLPYLPDGAARTHRQRPRRNRTKNRGVGVKPNAPPEVRAHQEQVGDPPTGLIPNAPPEVQAHQEQLSFPPGVDAFEDALHGSEEELNELARQALKEVEDMAMQGNLAQPKVATAMAINNVIYLSSSLKSGPILFARCSRQLCKTKIASLTKILRQCGEQGSGFHMHDGSCGETTVMIQYFLDNPEAENFKGAIFTTCGKKGVKLPCPLHLQSTAQDPVSYGCSHVVTMGGGLWTKAADFKDYSIIPMSKQNLESRGGQPQKPWECVKEVVRIDPTYFK
ncbi:hypothetical protein BU26DRAFT_511268 [Trematosphaeria pertusa]|uniref:Uncharacterized protein n=1 Tax=Trematosphaeria pertusa TaxID=390896 RepID=A0A6A6HVX9_9PLEO|nr:uncharacterized protein BU26DRAFT_511268 [Trematosphaeria pertusa]KAF2241892.1 hypothetical protein BU26DRAFT_511268 [Trematosphaeria pertusa]